MYEWSYALSALLFLCLTAGNLALGLIRRFRAFGLISMGIAELVTLFNLVLAVIAVSGQLDAKTSTVEYFFYAVCALLIPIAALTWTLIQRNSFEIYVYAIANVTLFVMVFRMHQIWFGS